MMEVKKLLLIVVHCFQFKAWIQITKLNQLKDFFMLKIYSFVYTPNFPLTHFKPHWNTSPKHCNVKMVIKALPNVNMALRRSCECHLPDWCLRAQTRSNITMYPGSQTKGKGEYIWAIVAQKLVARMSIAWEWLYHQ